MVHVSHLAVQTGVQQAELNEIFGHMFDNRGEEEEEVKARQQHSDKLPW